MKRLTFVVLAAFVLVLGLGAFAQGPRAPVSLPTWHGSTTLGGGGAAGAMLVYNSISNTLIATGCPPGAGFSGDRYMEDPSYPLFNGHVTTVQVETGTAAPFPSFVRWGLPPYSSWPGCLAYVGNAAPGSYGTTTGTVPLAFIISNAGQLVSLENTGGVTYIERYVRAGPIAEGWTISGGETVRLSNFPSYPLMTVTQITVDHNGTFWIAGYNPGYGQVMALWSWVAGGVPSNPTVYRGAWALAAVEQPSWITAVRPYAGYTQGLIVVTGWDLPGFIFQNGVNAYTFDPASSGTVTWAGIGGSQVWPDTRGGATGNGVWIVRKVAAAASHALIYNNFAGTACTQIFATPDPRILQMDKLTPAGVDNQVVSGTGTIPAIDQWTQACPAGFIIRLALAPPLPDIRGGGWNYPEYIATGFVTKN